MNNFRRKQLQQAMQLLEEANDIINDVMDEEDMSFNNLSDGLQQTMRGETMENNIDEMNDAISSICDAISSLDNIE